MCFVITMLRCYQDCEAQPSNLNTTTDELLQLYYRGGYNSARFSRLNLSQSFSSIETFIDAERVVWTVMTEIDPNSPVPIYHQLKLTIKEKIESGEFKPGERIPTEQELCERYVISRTPVRQALKELTYEGVLTRRRSLGTFVAPPLKKDKQPATPVCLMASDMRWATLVRRAASQWNQNNLHRQVDLKIVLKDHDELHSALVTAVVEGTAPDAVMIDSVWVAEFANAGYFVPLDELDAQWTYAEYANDLYPAFIESNKFEEHFYGLQVEADLSLLWYRRDWFDAEGLYPPTDWNDLLNIAQYFKRPDVRDKYGLPPWPFIFPGSQVAAEATTYNLLPFIWSAGGKVITDGYITLNNKATCDAVQFIGDLVNKHAVTPPDIVEWDSEETPRRLARGEAVMSLGGSYESLTILENGDWEEGEFSQIIGFCSPPAAPGCKPATAAGGVSHAILRQSRHPKLVMDLLKLAVDKKLASEFCKLTFQNSPRPSMQNVFSDEDIPLLAGTSRMLSSALARPSTPEYMKVSKQLQNMFESVITQSDSVEEAVRRAAEGISAITGLPLR